MRLSLNADANNTIIKNNYITGWANGVRLAGSVNSFKLVENWIHDNTANGLLIGDGAAVGGVVTIEGNLFKNNDGNGIQNDGTAVNNIGETIRSSSRVQLLGRLCRAGRNRR